METKLSLKFDTFFDPENDLLSLTRDFKNFEFVSQKWENILGWTLEELNQKEIKDLVHPDDWDKTVEFLQGIPTRKSVGGYTNRYITKDKQVKWLQWRIFSTSDVCFGLATDLTEMKLNLEEEKQKTIQATKLATLGEMAAGLAHEVNNPLTIIFGYVRVIEEDMASKSMDYDKFHAHLGLIKNAAERAARIVNNLKDFARDGSNDPIELIPVSQIITMSLDLCQERFKKNGIKLSLDLRHDPSIQCRKIELSQVLLNLLSNSFDAVISHPEKWVKVYVASEAGKVSISVADSGPKLPAYVLEKLFQPFFTTKKRGLGTGLGLSISQRIISKHGGEIFYDSIGETTMFVVRLPLKEGAL